MRRLSWVVLIGLCRGLVLAGTVQAGPPRKMEGDWQSRISGALTGFESRGWKDKNLDNDNTYVYFERCRDSVAAKGDNADVGLYRHRPAFPDAHLGTKTLQCYVQDTANWGVVRAGDYHFTIKKIRGEKRGYRIDVPYVLVGY